MDIRCNSNIIKIWTFQPQKTIFCKNFASNFGFFLNFTQKTISILHIIMMHFGSVSSDVSNCIVLRFIYETFQVSSSKKLWSYQYLNLQKLFESPSKFVNIWKKDWIRPPTPLGLMNESMNKEIVKDSLKLYFLFHVKGCVNQIENQLPSSQ